MLVLEAERATEPGLVVEIECRWPVGSAAGDDLAGLGVAYLKANRIVRFEGEVDPRQVEALVDPLADRIVDGSADEGSDWLDVFCLPGVTDAEGEMWQKALSLAAASCFEGAAHAGIRHHFAHRVDEPLRPSVEKLLGNAIVHQFVWRDGASPEPWEPTTGESSARVSDIPVRFASEDALLEISHRYHLALDLDEMQTIAEHFVTLGREPTDVELQSIALTWSEHCSHKTFKSPIDFRHNDRLYRLDGLLRSCFAEPTAQLDRSWVRSAFVDNAGVIALDDEHDLAFKVETHNHPSALEPYGGAHTGVGGVIRDVLAVSAEPIANTDVLCFGPLDTAEADVPAGAFHPRRTFREVVRGVADYGNNMGIPTVAGAILFDRSYTANPLVFCGTAGIVPRDRHPREPRPGDLVVLLGGRTGRDGLHGATMSSDSLDRQSVAATSVQIGAPITEKTLRDVIPHLRDEQLYNAITDCGAGGLCSAVGEMGGDLGVDVELASVPLKYAGLSPWEIWLSEAQERMVLAVSPDFWTRVLEVCREHDLEATVIGSFRDDAKLKLHHNGESVADLEMAFLHKGRHTRVLAAAWTDESPRPRQADPHAGLQDSLLRLLAHPNIASKESVIRRYDHEVLGGTFVKPLTARGGPSDGALLRPLVDSDQAVVIAHGINPLYGRTDPYAMALLAIDEALRNLVALGGDLDRVALLDNFCWGDVDEPQELGALVRAAQGCRDAAIAYGAPFISGKDSLRNTSDDATGRHSIPRTLLISAIGVTRDSRAMTSDLKSPGNHLYLVGTTRDELGDSHYLEISHSQGGRVPQVHAGESVAAMRVVSAAIREGLVTASHDLSEGGLAVAAAEMALSAGLGLDLQLDQMPTETPEIESLLFAESPGRFLLEIPPEKREAFEDLASAVPHAALGEVTGRPRFIVRQRSEIHVDLPVAELAAAWKSTLNNSDREKGSAEGSHSQHQQIRNSYLGSSSAVKTGPKAIVLAAAGINCDRETAEGCERAGAEVQPAHVNRLLSGEIRLDDFDMLIFPGGFSFGDHLGAGNLLAATWRHRLAADLDSFVESGRPVLGICNGFQVLARLGLLGDVALVANESGLFECRWVDLRVEDGENVFLRGLDRFRLPIAHGEGRLVTSSKALSDVLSRAPLRYVDNPNGSIAGIAGVTNAGGNVFGLMPHPERFTEPLQHPGRQGPAVGLQIFRNAVAYARHL